jgi:predicted MFS family arabinose efflux permease
MILLFLTALIFIGVGGGCAFIGIRTILILERRCGANEAGYSNFYAGWIAGTNVGMIIGTIIVELATRVKEDGSEDISYKFSAPFVAALGILLLSVLLEKLQIKKFILQCQTNNYVTVLRERKMFRYFFSDWRVVAFIFFHTIPSFAVVAFLYYFLPVFADSQGYSTTTVGWYLLIAGILTIYCGPPLTSFLHRFFTKEQSLYFSAVFWSSCLLLFVVTGSWEGAVATVLALGFCDGFAGPCTNFYFVGLKRSQEIGESAAIAYYELASKIGDALGPIILSALILLGGNRKGVLMLFLICITCTFIMFVINRFAEKD